MVAQSNVPIDDEGHFLQPNRIKARKGADFPVVTDKEVDLMDVAPNQIASIAASLIPFLEHDDANRALMGSNMMRQAVPLVTSEAPIVGTGIEKDMISDSRIQIVAEGDGEVVFADATKIQIKYERTEDEILASFAPEVTTYTLPRYQMVAGIFDIMNHITEQYFSNTDDNTSDYLAEGLMRSLVTASRAAVANPTDYEARSNIMWTATWALNTLVGCGKTQDWEVHMIGQAVGAVTDATHGMTLSAVALPYYRLIMPYGLEKFARFATNVWGIDTAGKTNEELAAAGLNAMENWMREIGCVMSIRELGADESSLDAIADATLTMTGGYRTLTRAEVLNVLRKSLAAK